MRSKITKKNAITTMSLMHWKSGKCIRDYLCIPGLLMLFMMMILPGVTQAEIITTTYDFEAAVSAEDTEVTKGELDGTYTDCNYFTKIGIVENPGRFAAQGIDKWSLFRNGLYNNNSGGRRFLIKQLYNNDVVTFSMVANEHGTDVQLVSVANATESRDNVFTMTANGTLAVIIPQTSWITKITIQHDDAAIYAYDPGVEIYDLSSATGNTGQLGSAGYNFFQSNGAYYIQNPTGLELNNRVAIWTDQADSWKYDGGLKNVGTGPRILGISNLKADDRIRITFTGDVRFCSRYNSNNNTYSSFLASGNLFLDGNNDGVQDDGEATITDPGTSVISGAIYTMLADGHVDIAVPRSNGVITKIEIFCDHKASVIDTDANDGQGTHTMTFDNTGQLVEKTAYLASGLTVSFGNNSSSAEHVLVTASNEGFASYVKDFNGYKFMGADNNIPTWGTFYKFVPEKNGKLTLKWKAQSLKYPNGAASETVSSEACPYYVAQGNTTNTPAWGPSAKSNGANMSCTIDVTQGNVYYLYGGWNTSGSVGIARLYEVSFTPSFYLNELAKLGTYGMTEDTNLTSGSLTGASAVVKAMTANITGAEPYIENGKLGIRNITYADGANKGGAISISVSGNGGSDVFVLTIPYSAQWNNGEGHTWDFSSNELKIGRYFKDFFTDATDYVNNHKEVDVSSLEKNTSSQLYSEINKGTGANPDWNFTYRVKSTTGIVHDPMFQNVYDMEGDNFDMIWETEGLWFETPQNKSAIFNEKIGSIDRSNKTQADPDRYVAILPDADGKSLFTIPGLKKDDRVIIYMGSGEGSGANACFFNIINARDAVHNEIAETDVYKAGGSEWNLVHADPNYRGCYHFFAKEDGNMTFKLVGGSMVKLYSIQIYHGDRIETNGMLNASGSSYIFVNDEGASEGVSNSYNLHYRGKGEVLAKPQILANSGKITTDESNYSTTGIVSTYKSNVGDFGVIRMRVKCVEYEGKYVTDYADRNLTVGYKEKVDYPYTWDFTDMKTYSGNNIAEEYTKYPETTDSLESKGWDLSMWDADGAIILRNPDVPKNETEIFSHNKYGNGNQLYANGKIIPETQGLWFYFDNNDNAYNGCMKIDRDGLHLANPSYENGASVINARRGWWNNKVVIPNVPAGGAVYLRAARDESVSEEPVTFTNNGVTLENELYFYKSYQFNSNMEDKAVIGSDADSKLYQPDDESGEWVMAFYNSGAESNLTLTLNGWILKKLSVSVDKKTLDSNGWATESRARVIDPELTKYLTGYDIESCAVKDVKYGEAGMAGAITLERILDPATGISTKVMKSMEDGQEGAYILHYTEDKPLEILNGGFHLFVPDMHDYAGENVGVKSLSESADSKLVAQVSAGTIPATSGDYTNYVLSNKYYKNGEGEKIPGSEAFYRVKSTGATSNGNNGYLPLLTSKVTNANAANGFTLSFDNGYDSDGIAEMKTEMGTAANGTYTINGQKVEAVPTVKGIYIVNGKKVVIK